MIEKDREKPTEREWGNAKKIGTTLIYIL